VDTIEAQFDSASNEWVKVESDTIATNLLASYQTSADATGQYVNVTGDTMTGPLVGTTVDVYRLRSASGATSMSIKPRDDDSLSIQAGNSGSADGAKLWIKGSLGAYGTSGSATQGGDIGILLGKMVNSTSGDRHGQLIFYDTTTSIVARLFNDGNWDFLGNVLSNAASASAAVSNNQLATTKYVMDTAASEGWASGGAIPDVATYTNAGTFTVPQTFNADIEGTVLQATPSNTVLAGGSFNVGTDGSIYTGSYAPTNSAGSVWLDDGVIYAANSAGSFVAAISGLISLNDAPYCGILGLEESSGLHNIDGSDNSWIIGGNNNRIVGGNDSTILGGINNKTEGAYQFIGGGGNNEANGNAIGGVIVGGDNNFVEAGDYLWTVGGQHNHVDGGNDGNSGIAGGAYNHIVSGKGATIVGGEYNDHAAGNMTVILGGRGSTNASGSHCLIGPSYNYNDGDWNTLLGAFNSATNDRVFMWSSEATIFDSDQDREFAVQADQLRLQSTNATDMLIADGDNGLRAGTQHSMVVQYGTGTQTGDYANVAVQGIVATDSNIVWSVYDSGAWSCIWTSTTWAGRP
jgi:hypothetical protein